MTACSLSGLLFLPQAESARVREAYHELTDEQLEARLFHMHHRRDARLHALHVHACPCFPVMRDVLDTAGERGVREEVSRGIQGAVLCTASFAYSALPRSVSMHVNLHLPHAAGGDQRRAEGRAPRALAAGHQQEDGVRAAGLRLAALLEPVGHLPGHASSDHTHLCKLTCVVLRSASTSTR